MNYPLKQKTVSKQITNYSNRGMDLEADLNVTNKYYIDNNIAIIHKKPTPIKVVKVNYKNSNSVINEAYFKEPSTTDYNGIYKGRYIDFEAKEINNSNYFALCNIHKHQIDHLKNIILHGGIGFIIVRFIKINKTFLLSGNKLFDFLISESRKSIPLSYFENEGIIIKDSYMPRLDYLKAIDQIIMDGDKVE